MNNSLKFEWLGQVPYEQSLQLQSDHQKKILNEDNNGVIWGLEHPAVITLGVRGTLDDIKNQKFPIIKIRRGGRATIHNPGQLVIYPVLKLSKWGWGAKDYIETLLLVTENTLKKCNITIVGKNNGLFTSSGKIASIGCNIKRGISSHGIAINVCNNLEDFNSIYVCGSQKQSLDQVSNYQKQMTTKELFLLWQKEFLFYTGDF